MLTISQLARFTGVTVRAVRHYHQCGLLPEPDRDASGYRRYGVQDVVDLIRIKTLAEAGVPLSRVSELLEADPEQFAQAVGEIDRDLRAQARQIQRHRQRVASLVAGDGLGPSARGHRLPEPAPRVRVSDEFRQVYLAFDEAFDWSPDDPRLEGLADRVADLLKQLSLGALIERRGWSGWTEGRPTDPTDPRGSKGQEIAAATSPTTFFSTAELHFWSA